MNKGDLIENVANESGLSKADAGRAVDALIGAVTGALKKGGQVSLLGLVHFRLRRVLRVWAGTREQVRRFKSRPAMCLVSRLEKP